MKQLLLIIFCCTNLTFAQQVQHREWHVKPYPIEGNGADNTIGDGTSFETAWALQNALNNPGNVIQAGDTVWLHHGDYKGHFISSFNGTINDYITVASYPGEWARLDGNIYPYVEPQPQPLSRTSSPNYIPLTYEEELETYSINDEDENSNSVLKVNSAFVHFDNFEITCLGPINRLLIGSRNSETCGVNNGFNKIVGINHSNATVNKFSNLVIRNMPGTGISSWKLTSDTEIYGCLIYNNGYIREQHDPDCSSLTYSIIGKGPGIYTQNSTGQTRLIENNIILNNYDTGIDIWSASKVLPINSDFLKNYHVKDNVLINNGGPQRDETPNMNVNSDAEGDNNNPHDILIDGNIFYLNSAVSDVSGLFVGHSKDVTITNNEIYKGTTCIQARSNNNDLTFQYNYLWGKRIQLYIDATNYINKNWEFDHNLYHLQLTPMYQTNSSSFGIGYFRTHYFGDNISTHLGVDSYPSSDYLLKPEYLTPITSSNYEALNATFTNRITVVQNKYNPNKFYVTLFTPDTDVNPELDFDFSPYGIPNNTFYTIKDAENYFPIPPTVPITGNLTGNTITFPMTLTDIEPPTGILNIDFVSNVMHSARDLSVFVVEFGCQGLEYDKTIANQTDASTLVYSAKNNITLGANYVANTSSNVTALASKSIKVISNTHFKAGSKVLLRIEDPCPDIPLLTQQPQSRISGVSDKAKEEDVANNSLIISPNPNSGIFSIEDIKGLKIKQVIIREINSARIVFEQQYNDESKVDINISNQPLGLYTVNVVYDDNTSVSKTIIKK